ncbi:MAG: helix-turn-helix domain-containing protein [Candidatus Nanopelagicaceae bacterium]|jgi:transcriptional regulator with XRE-family HTH domain
MSELGHEYRNALIRLRQVRERAGLTLKQVESMSDGRWKAGAVGCYERGTRFLTLERAIELLDFYGAQISVLAPLPEMGDPRIIINLRNLRNIDQSDYLTRAIKNLIQNIKLSRGDWNSELITLRKSDFQNLRAVTGYLDESFLIALEIRGLLLSSKRQ